MVKSIKTTEVEPVEKKSNIVLFREHENRKWFLTHGCRQNRELDVVTSPARLHEML